ncbi:flagellin [Paenibacillus sp. 1011MAR3C5]|uniref:flagellin N-terminal helical domain-containing protein n=1 Tax=Paenibacillus sp. 1011MAR3C5 TaxID=1675787 RepID=UPI000E6C645F|nr:flagellin [Paenibacillus sp. 1011MAR3C5]RJE85635.1 flagellin [Paenibacillus sp. 1011MAR3C5]
MRINHNITALNNHRNMGLNTVAAGKNMEKLSSGLKINRAADDAAGLAVSEKMRGQIRGLEQAQRNVQDGVSFVQTAEGAMNEVSAMLTRMKELNVQALNGTYSSTDVDNIELEVNELRSQISSIMADTKFNGINIQSSGTATQVAIQADDAAQVINIDLITTTSFVMNAAITSLNATSLASIETAIESVATERAKLGATQNRLEYTSNNLGTTVENLTAAESRIRDTDMAKEMVELTKNNILLQASQAMLAQANSAPQGVLSLLR